jgi:hypothetical protein
MVRKPRFNADQRKSLAFLKLRILTLSWSTWSA